MSLPRPGAPGPLTPNLPPLHADFVTGCYGQPGRWATSFLDLPGTSFSRAGVGYAETSGGLLVPFAAGAPRITDRGLLIEEGRTNVVRWCRDLTNAAWTKTNATAALDQTGADGSVNSASSITATAANATVLQSNTLASSARFQSAWVRRLVGSGTVEMTMDGGTTWTAITLSASFAAVSIPSQTLANPNVGFRFATSGDKIAVDFVQNENGVNRTSPVVTTTASATRGADAARIDYPFTFPLSLYAKGRPSQTTASVILAQLDNGGTGERALIFHNTVVRAFVVTGSVNQALIERPGVVVGAPIRAAARFSTDDVGLVFNGGAEVTDTLATMPTVTGLTVGARPGGDYFNSYVEEIRVYPRGLAAAELQALTA